LSNDEQVANVTVDVAQQLSNEIRGVFAVERIIQGLGDGRGIRLEGQLLTDSASAYDYIADRFQPLGYTPILREQQDRFAVTALPTKSEAKPTRDRVALLFFGLTVLSMLFAGALSQAPDLQWVIRHPLSGAPFAVALLAILLAHELGHYFMSRHYSVSASLPYFIPMPLSPFGTMGAVIRTRTPMRDRRQLLAIGAAGPVAGLLVAIPALLLGLRWSTVQLIPTGEGIFLEGNSLLYAGFKLLVFGRILPSNGYDVFLHPVAFAAWAGLLVTALNLIPAGQLDGGHIAYALLGRRARWLNRLAAVAALGLSLLWSGWLLWAAVILFFGQRNAEPLNDVTSLTSWQTVFAVAMLVLFALLFTPMPMTILTLLTI
jgi:membrane-associated protease RseP (regulator of RpoE activity)